MDNIQTYTCASDAPDVLVAYTAVQGAGIDNMFALVCSSKQQGELKVSVLLTKEDALRLRAQLDTFIIQSAIARSK